jgi:glycosyltransferase involved in cell wall biosynthesis
MQKQKISFCITCYDKDYHLLDNLFSHIESQTEAPEEILVFCSGVKNGQINRLDHLIVNKQQVPISYIIQEKRTIQSVARNKCQSAAKNEIIIFFDVDDFPHPQKIEITKKIFEKYDPDFLLHSYSTGKLLKYKINPNQTYPHRDLFCVPYQTTIFCLTNPKPIHHAHIAVKKHCFDKVKFNESIPWQITGRQEGEDSTFCQDLIKNSFEGIFINEKLVWYTNS